MFAVVFTDRPEEVYGVLKAADLGMILGIHENQGLKRAADVAITLHEDVKAKGHRVIAVVRVVRMFSPPWKLKSDVSYTFIGGDLEMIKNRQGEPEITEDDPIGMALKNAFTSLEEPLLETSQDNGSGDFIECPLCGHKIRDLHDYAVWDEGTREMECEECCQTFDLSTMVTHYWRATEKKRPVVMNREGKGEATFDLGTEFNKFTVHNDN